MAQAKVRDQLLTKKIAEMVEELRKARIIPTSAKILPTSDATSLLPDVGEVVFASCASCASWVALRPHLRPELPSNSLLHPDTTSPHVNVRMTPDVTLPNPWVQTNPSVRSFIRLSEVTSIPPRRRFAPSPPKFTISKFTISKFTISGFTISGLVISGFSISRAHWFSSTILYLI